MDAPYVWIDPFEEQARANRAEARARTAREDGRREILSMVSGQAKEGFDRHLGFAVEQAAVRVANEVIMPQAARDYPEYDRRRMAARTMALGLAEAAAPVSAHITHHGEVSLSVADWRPEQMTVTVQTVRPFQYHVAMDTRMWR